MAGGVGSRFWPMSTEEKPKQFLDVLGIGKTLLQQTVNRFGSICPAENILVVTSAIYKDIVMEQCPVLLKQNILLEPCMRNTAPCIAYAAFKIKKTNPEANIIVAPSDHLITDENEFKRIINSALEFTAQSDNLLTLGIKPHRPETGYGYIESPIEALVDDKDINKPKKVIAFKEKPDLQIAEKYLIFSGGGYFRLTPYPIIKSLTKKSDYLMSYLHPRDLDFKQPKIKELSFFRKFKSYVGLKGAESKLNKWLTDFDFIDIATADKQIDWNTVKKIQL